MTGAFAGGMVLKGKSGWCSTICPLLPVQRIYGQTPLLMVANAHCQPCVGCVKNCYDFNPRAAYLADLNEGDTYWSGYRKYFVGALPGRDRRASSRRPNLGHGWRSPSHEHRVLRDPGRRSGRRRRTGSRRSTGRSPSRCSTGGRARSCPSPDVAGARSGDRAGRHVVRAHDAEMEKPFLESVDAGRSPPPAGTVVGRRCPTLARRAANAPEVTLRAREHAGGAQARGRRCSRWPRAPGMTIEAGCRMGVCGADPVAIRSGLEHCRASPTTSWRRSSGSATPPTPGWRAACGCPARSRSRSTPDKAEAPQPRARSRSRYDTIVEQGRGDRQRHRGRDRRRPARAAATRTSRST